MTIYRNFLLACAAFVLIAGCQKTPEPKTAANTGATANTGASANAGQSVALPPNQVPPSDATIPPKVAAASSSGDANTPTQANPAALSKGQEQNTLPHSGQVNNHSVPNTTGENK